ncbi:hypothetical protein CCP3SC1_480011 [Gammaproteobacteria bacterium]
MKNLTDTETLLFVGFFVLCVCVIFMLGLCLKNGCLYRLRHRGEHHPESITPRFPFQLHRPSSAIVPSPNVIDDKQSTIWVDSGLPEERPKAFLRQP